MTEQEQEQETEISEEALAAIQAKVSERFLENSGLKSEYDTLKKDNMEMSGFEEQLPELEKQKEEARERHAESVNVMREEIEKIQKEAEETMRRMNERTVEVNQGIADLTKKIKELEVDNERLSNDVAGHDADFKSLTGQLQLFASRSEDYVPFLKFIRMSRAFPMYIEDLSTRADILNGEKIVASAEVSRLRESLSDVKLARARLESNIAGHEKLIESLSNTRENAMGTLRAAECELKESEEALSKLGQRKDECVSETEKMLRERKEMEDGLATQLAESESELRDYDKRKGDLDAELEELRNGGHEVEDLNLRITRIRKRLTHIKDTGTDPKVPCLDRDLRRQIEKVKAEMDDIWRDTEVAEKECKRLDIQVQQKDWELQTACLKCNPTPELAESMDFQAKQLLLQELVLQNREMRIRFTELTERTASLKRENQEIRKQLQG